MTLRPARSTDTQLLSDLALRSKGHWGYEPDFLEACRAELTIDDATLAAESVVVLDADGAAARFSGLRGDGPGLELTYLFVDPAHIGHGAGRALLTHALDAAATRGAQR